MSLLYLIIGAVISYLIGSLPTAVWYGKALYGIDVRDYGSGNAGATNTFRVLGKKPGIIVMLVDILKGWTATNAAHLLLLTGVISADYLVVYKLVFGICAVIRHVFPVYVGFRGGKGIATLLGMVLSIHIEAALVCFLIFCIVLLLSKYVSLGSMMAALAFPILLMLPRFNPEEPLVVIFGFAIFSMVILTHQKNIIRLINGEENKAKIRIRRQR